MIINKGQILLVVGASILTLGLYLGGDMVPPKDVIADTHDHQNKELLIDDFIKNSKEGLDRSLVNMIESAETLVQSGNDSSLITIAEHWESAQNFLVAGYYRKQAAEKGDLSQWTKAGNDFITMLSTKDSSILNYSAVQAKICYEKAVEVDSLDLDARVGLAVSVIEGENSIMQGVQILLKVVKKDPEHIQANLILARLSMLSGQYEKAVVRLEKLIELIPHNAESYLMLAEAYKRIDRTDDAINALIKCKNIIEDPGIKAEIDQYIEEIKNS